MLKFLPIVLLAAAASSVQGETVTASVNLLTTVSGITCSASSQYNADFACQYAYDGTLLPTGKHEWASKGQNEGAWMEVDFKRQVVVDHMNMWQRCYNSNQYREFKLTYSDGTIDTVDVSASACTGGERGGVDCRDPADKSPPVSVSLSPIVTSKVRIEGARDCEANAANNGIRELQIFGHAYTQVNLLKTVSGITCSASSQYNADFACQYAYDGTLLPTGKHEWASKGQNEGAWMEMEFPITVLIDHMNMWQRCYNANQYREFKMTYSDGTSEVVDVSGSACDGGKSGVDCRDPADKSARINVNLKPVLTKSVRIEGRKDCEANKANNGIREVQLMGSADEAIIARLSRRSQAC